MYNRSAGERNYYIKLKMMSALVFLAVSFAAAAQQTGVAVEESPFSVKVNPALMGTGNSAGIGWSGDFDDEGFNNTYSFLMSGKNMAYYYDSQGGEGSHNFALAFPSGYGFFTGTSLFFPEDSSRDIMWNISAAIRPVRSLSLGVRTMDITSGDSYLIYGAGLRPFFFSPYWISRLTFFADLKYQDENELTTAGIRAEPLDGINIYSEYFFEDEVFEAGISISLSHLTAGIKGSAEKNEIIPERGKASVYIPFKRERTSVKAPVSLIAEYDMGNIIRDYPVSGGLADFVPLLRSNYSNSIYNFIRDMEDIAETDEIKAVIFKNQMFLTSYANISEISDALKRLKEKGKKIYFYFDNAGNNSYTLAASAADEIFLNSSGFINLRGYSKRSLYMKDFFSRFGVEFYNFRSHDYKTAFNSFSESEMTEAERDILDNLYARFREKQISMIETGRGERLNGNAADLIASGPYLSSREAKEKGLVDRRIYKDELNDFYREKDYIPVRYSVFPEKKNYDWNSLGSKILPVIYASGDIVSGNGISGRMIGSESFSAAVRAARNNPSVKCIIIRINSGGGSAFASDVIAHEIALCRTGENPKPVIVSMGGAAASGGYYMAAPAEIIFTDEVSLTGSIGVIALFPDISGLLEKLGIKYEAVNSSDNSDFGSPLKPLTEEEIEKIRNYISENYSRFLDIVKKYRKLTDSEADYAAQGKVWAGNDAVRLKLADRTGGIADALSYALDKYYKGNEVRITETVPGGRLFDLPFLFSSVRSGKVDKNPLLADELNEVLEFYRRLDSFEKGEALYLFPYTDRESGTSE